MPNNPLNEKAIFNVARTIDSRALAGEGAPPARITLAEGAR